MFEEKVELRRKREFSDVLNASFGFVKQEFKVLGKTLLLYAGIPVLVQAILSAFYVDTTITDIFTNIGNNQVAVNEYSGGAQGKALLFNLINMVVTVFLTGIAYCYIVLYKEKGSGNIEPKEVWNKFTEYFLSFIGFSILKGIVIILALIALIIPGIYVLVPLSMILIIKVEENKGFSDSFSRCFYLVKNHWWETFGLMIIAGIIVMITSMVFTVPAAALGIAETTILQNGQGMNTVPIVITALFSTIGTAVITPLPAIIYAFQYYSLVEHKDNLSLYDKINKINEEPEKENE